MYIFPSSLIHYTEPVLGKEDYRYSISCNFCVLESLKRHIPQSHTAPRGVLF